MVPGANGPLVEWSTRKFCLFPPLLSGWPLVRMSYAPYTYSSKVVNCTGPIILLKRAKLCLSSSWAELNLVL